MRPPRHFLGTAWWASEHGLFQTGACDALLTQVNMFSERKPGGLRFWSKVHRSQGTHSGAPDPPRLLSLTACCTGDFALAPRDVRSTPVVWAATRTLEVHMR